MTEEQKQKLDKILARFTAGKKDDLIPVLNEVQEEFRYLPPEIMQEVARFLRVPESTVYGVSTFYALFRLTPGGKKMVMVCRGTACHVRGGARILREIERRLGIKPGQVTPDLEYSLNTVACIGACALAPNITINRKVYGQMTTKKVAEVFGDGSKAKE